VTTKTQTLFCLLVLLAVTANQEAGAQVATSTSTSTLTDDTASNDLNTLIQVGIAAYKKRDYETAEGHLGKAWKLSHTPLVAATLATTEMKLKHYRAAGEHWSVYLRNLATNQQAERAETLAQLEICRKYSGAVQLVVDEPQATVTIDGNDIDLTETGGEVWLEPGNYTISAHKLQRTSELQTLTIKPGDLVTVRLTLPPETVTLSSKVTLIEASIKPNPTKSKGLAPKTVVLLGESALTLIAIGVGTGYFIAWHSANSDAVDLRKQVALEAPSSDGPCSLSKPPAACGPLRQRVDDSIHDAKVLNVLMPTTAVLAAVTIGTYLLWPDSKAAQPATAGLSVSPWVGETTKGAVLQGAF
jgi:hypothetical protein